MSDAFTVAANAGATLNVSFVTFDNTGGPGAYDVADASGFPTQFANKLTDNSADFGAGFANADAWFDTVETATSTNALFFIGDGFSSDPWDTDYAAMMTDHNVIVDAFVPDVVYNGTGFDALSTMDKDGFADSIFVEDTATANLYGVTAGVDALSLDHLLA